ncbi:TPA: hypothetical protein DIC20_00875 [Candidatus Dependentiae bacterium]|nr:MAG: hypothetical protein US03_C0015G0019 [candidate division TM6 bacterium GW2011_GWF2_36_131]KKQ02818.1 MAG: hypothetical protein US13_C0009G0010 [candidate division TM6 bacterium GW2011_GWE2_36_25]KKQ18973.1 MAG: hypothetical protein US32_C0019G0016 [candidate division TM6 bacterium GW2011_GWA2_36_9]HBR70997.1 hypothetical protein [Candidatus Dependentiae bacterium]HCU00240.1 hypothetical protein [Candidatus Dependentiae bacterium]
MKKIFISLLLIMLCTPKQTKPNGEGLGIGLGVGALTGIAIGAAASRSREPKVVYVRAPENDEENDEYTDDDDYQSFDEQDN